VHLSGVDISVFSSMKIITLIENLVARSELVAEHGLSFYLETPTRRILFDTGQTGAFLANAKILGIDIAAIDTVVLSHGHFDHTGGLSQFLALNAKAKIYCKQEAFEEKFHGPKKYIGSTIPAHLLENRVYFVNETIEIDTGFFIVPEIPVKNKQDTAFYNFQVKKNNEFCNDEVRDELFIAIVKNNKLSIVSSCSHRGITNMVKHARELFPKSPVNLVLGGFHLKDENVGQYPEIVNYFNEIKPESIGTCHCTGVEMYARLRNDCSTSVFYNFTGHSINL